MEVLFENLATANKLLDQYIGFAKSIPSGDYQAKIQANTRINELEEIIDEIKQGISYWQHKNFERGAQHETI